MDTGIFKVVKREYMQGKKLYTLEDYAGDPVEGRFYREELQPVTVTGDEVYRFEKVIKTVRKKEYRKWSISQSI